MFSGFFATDSSASSSAFLAASSASGIASASTYRGERPATCIARSRTSFWNSSVRATKSVSQLTSISTPTLPPVWM